MRSIFQRFAGCLLAGSVVIIREPFLVVWFAVWFGSLVRWFAEQ